MLPHEHHDREGGLARAVSRGASVSVTKGTELWYRDKAEPPTGTTLSGCGAARRHGDAPVGVRPRLREWREISGLDRADVEARAVEQPRNVACQVQAFEQSPVYRFPSPLPA